MLRVMVIGAHPDDCDFCFGGTAVKFARLGHKVKFISATNGDTGHHINGGGELARRRYAETQKAAEIAGIEYEVFDIHNNGLTVDIPTREQFIRAIRKFSPDILLTHRTVDYHPDHRATATLVQDSSYAIMIPNVCPLTPVMKKPPVIMFLIDNFTKPCPFAPDVVIDIDDAIDTKARMLDCQESQMYEWLAYMDGTLDIVPAPGEDRIEWIKKNSGLHGHLETAERFRDKLLERYGECGRMVKWAEAFELSEYGRIPTEDELMELFPF